MQHLFFGSICEIIVLRGSGGLILLSSYTSKIVNLLLEFPNTKEVEVIISCILFMLIFIYKNISKVI
jgi:uncharacterized membrane protein (DUF373 family)